MKNLKFKRCVQVLIVTICCISRYTVKGQSSGSSAPAIISGRRGTLGILTAENNRGGVNRFVVFVPNNGQPSNSASTSGTNNYAQVNGYNSLSSTRTPPRTRSGGFSTLSSTSTSSQSQRGNDLRNLISNLVSQAITSRTNNQNSNTQSSRELISSSSSVLTNTLQNALVQGLAAVTRSRQAPPSASTRAVVQTDTRNASPTHMINTNGIVSQQASQFSGTNNGQSAGSRIQINTRPNIAITSSSSQPVNIPTNLNQPNNSPTNNDMVNRPNTNQVQANYQRTMSRESNHDSARIDQLNQRTSNFAESGRIASTRGHSDFHSTSSRHFQHRLSNSAQHENRQNNGGQRDIRTTFHQQDHRPTDPSQPDLRLSNQGLSNFISANVRQTHLQGQPDLRAINPSQSVNRPTSSGELDYRSTDSGLPDRPPSNNGQPGRRSTILGQPGHRATDPSQLNYRPINDQLGQQPTNPGQLGHRATNLSQLDYRPINNDQPGQQPTNSGQPGHRATDPSQLDYRPINNDQPGQQSTNPGRLGHRASNPSQLDYRPISNDQPGQQPTNPGQLGHRATNPSQLDYRPINPGQPDYRPSNPEQGVSRFRSTNLDVTDYRNTNSEQFDNRPNNFGQPDHRPTNPYQPDPRLSNEGQPTDLQSNSGHSEYRQTNSHQTDYPPGNPASSNNLVTSSGESSYRPTINVENNYRPTNPGQPDYRPVDRKLDYLPSEPKAILHTMVKHIQVNGRGTSPSYSPDQILRQGNTLYKPLYEGNVYGDRFILARSIDTSSAGGTGGSGTASPRQGTERNQHDRFTSSFNDQAVDYPPSLGYDQINVGQRRGNFQQTTESRQLSQDAHMPNTYPSVVSDISPGERPLGGIRVVEGRESNRFESSALSRSSTGFVDPDPIVSGNSYDHSFNFFNKQSTGRSQQRTPESPVLHRATKPQVFTNRGSTNLGAAGNPAEHIQVHVSSHGHGYGNSQSSADGFIKLPARSLTRDITSATVSPFKGDGFLVVDSDPSLSSSSTSAKSMSLPNIPQSYQTQTDHGASMGGLGFLDAAVGFHGQKMVTSSSERDIFAPQNGNFTAGGAPYLPSEGNIPLVLHVSNEAMPPVETALGPDGGMDYFGGSLPPGIPKGLIGGPYRVKDLSSTRNAINSIINQRQSQVSSQSSSGWTSGIGSDSSGFFTDISVVETLTCPNSHGDFGTCQHDSDCVIGSCFLQGSTKGICCE